MIEVYDYFGEEHPNLLEYQSRIIDLHVRVTNGYHIKSVVGRIPDI